MKKKMIILPLFAALSFVALSGFGGCRHRSPEERAQHMERMAARHVEGLLDDVEANDVQKERILGLTAQVTRDVTSLMKSHSDVRGFVRAEWTSERPDAARIHQQIDERIDALRATLHRTADAAIEVHGVLTPKQRQAVLEELE